jgi:hypothetical protein
VKIPVEITASEWDEIVHLNTEKDNEFLTEEDYVDKLMSIIGHKIRTRPVEGDELILRIRAPIFSIGKEDKVN